jgi:hypothetical protein
MQSKRRLPEPRPRIGLSETQLQSFGSGDETQRQAQELVGRKTDLQSLMKEREELSGALGTAGRPFFLTNDRVMCGKPWTVVEPSLSCGLATIVEHPVPGKRTWKKAVSKTT